MLLIIILHMPQFCCTLNILQPSVKFINKINANYWGNKAPTPKLTLLLNCC